jgi:acyl dehydratase
MFLNGRQGHRRIFLRVDADGNPIHRDAERGRQRHLIGFW